MFASDGQPPDSTVPSADFIPAEMQLNNTVSQVYFPGEKLAGQPGRITHLGIGAHPDDLEFMAWHGILACLDREDAWFGGVTCTDGAGSSRGGVFASASNAQMRTMRRREQEAAAVLGQYGVMIQLGYESGVVCDASHRGLQADLQEILRATRPRVIYTHNPADKHNTHVAVCLGVLGALREITDEYRPEAVYGCEAWRGLDWMTDTDKIIHDVSAREELADSLNSMFASQIAGGKRYDLAVAGRRRANATFLDPRRPDQATMVELAMDLTPLALDKTRSISDYVLAYVHRFEHDVRERLTKHLTRD